MADKLLTPQQELFLSYYTNPKSDTFSNAKQSALKAGYSEEYSNNITGQLPDWLSESLGDMKRLRKAERVLDRILELDPLDQEGKVDNALLKTQADVGKFFSKALDKKKYSERVEQDLTSKGESIKTINYIVPQADGQLTPPSV